ncbi:MAG: rod shape-determining protein MreD [Patescibacteria group bacterium]
MKYFLSFLIILFAVILQVSFLPHFKIYNVIPNLFLLILASWAILRQHREAYIWGFFGGLFLDLNSQILFGVNTLSFLVSALAIFFIIKNFVNVNNLVSKIILIFLASIFYKFVSLAFLILAGFFRLYSWFQLSKNFIYLIIIEIILNIILIFLVYPFIRGFHHFILRYEERRKV